MWCICAYHYIIALARDSFNLFWKFVGAPEQETSQNSLSVPALNLQDPSRLPMSDMKNPSNIEASNADWLFSLFSSNKGKIGSKKILYYQ